jgi:hypothetical protein
MEVAMGFGKLKINRRNSLKTQKASEASCAFRADSAAVTAGEARHKFPKR